MVQRRERAPGRQMEPTPHSSRVTIWCSIRAQHWKSGWTAIFKFHNDRNPEPEIPQTRRGAKLDEGSPFAFLRVPLCPSWLKLLYLRPQDSQPRAFSKRETLRHRGMRRSNFSLGKPCADLIIPAEVCHEILALPISCDATRHRTILRSGPPVHHCPTQLRIRRSGRQI